MNDQNGSGDDNEEEEIVAARHELHVVNDATSAEYNVVVKAGENWLRVAFGDGGDDANTTQTETQTTELKTQLSCQEDEAKDESLHMAVDRMEDSQVELLSGGELVLSPDFDRYPPNEKVYVCFEFLSGRDWCDSLLTVKDMREPSLSQSREDSAIAILRKRTMKPSKKSKDGGGVVEDWFELPRRKLTFLEPGDRISFSAPRDSDDNCNYGKIILEYHYTSPAEIRAERRRLPKQQEQQQQQQQQPQHDNRGNGTTVANAKKKSTTVDARSLPTMSQMAKEIVDHADDSTVDAGVAVAATTGGKGGGSDDSSDGSYNGSVSKPFDYGITNTYVGTKRAVLKSQMTTPSGKTSLAVDSTVHDQQESLRSARMNLLRTQEGGKEDGNGEFATAAVLENANAVKNSNGDDAVPMDTCEDNSGSSDKNKEGEAAAAKNMGTNVTRALLNLQEHEMKEDNDTDDEEGSRPPFSQIDVPTTALASTTLAAAASAVDGSDGVNCIDSDKSQQPAKEEAHEEAKKKEEEDSNPVSANKETDDVDRKINANGEKEVSSIEIDDEDDVTVPEYFTQSQPTTPTAITEKVKNTSSSSRRVAAMAAKLSTQPDDSDSDGQNDRNASNNPNITDVKPSADRDAADYSKNLGRDLDDIEEESTKVKKKNDYGDGGGDDKNDIDQGEEREKDAIIKPSTTATGDDNDEVAVMATAATANDKENGDGHIDEIDDNKESPMASDETDYKEDDEKDNDDEPPSPPSSPLLLSMETDNENNDDDDDESKDIKRNEGEKGRKTDTVTGVDHPTPDASEIVKDKKDANKGDDEKGETNKDDIEDDDDEIDDGASTQASEIFKDKKDENKGDDEKGETNKDNIEDDDDEIDDDASTQLPPQLSSDLLLPSSRGDKEEDDVTTKENTIDDAIEVEKEEGKGIGDNVTDSKKNCDAARSPNMLRETGESIIDDKEAQRDENQEQNEEEEVSAAKRACKGEDKNGGGASRAVKSKTDAPHSTSKGNQSNILVDENNAATTNTSTPPRKTRRGAQRSRAATRSNAAEDTEVESNENEAIAGTGTTARKTRRGAQRSRAAIRSNDATDMEVEGHQNAAKMSTRRSTRKRTNICNNPRNENIQNDFDLKEFEFLEKGRERQHMELQQPSEQPAIVRSSRRSTGKRKSITTYSKRDALNSPPISNKSREDSSSSEDNKEDAVADVATSVGNDKKRRRDLHTAPSTIDIEPNSSTLKKDSNSEDIKEDAVAAALVGTAKKRRRVQQVAVCAVDSEQSLSTLKKDSNSEDKEEDTVAAASVGTTRKRRRAQQVTASSIDGEPNLSTLKKDVDKFYKNQLTDAMNRKLIRIVTSSISTKDTEAIERFCKQRLPSGIKFKIEDTVNKNTTVCIIPDKATAKSNNGEEANNRTLKAIRSALLGIPMVSPKWIEACKRKGDVVMPSTFIRTLPAKVGSLCLSSDAKYGVTKLAAAWKSQPTNPDLLFRNADVLFCGTYTKEKKSTLNKLLKDGCANILTTTKNASLKLKSFIEDDDNSSTTTKNASSSSSSRQLVLLYGEDEGKAPQLLPGYLKKELEAALKCEQTRKFVTIVDSNWVSLSIACARMMPQEHFKPNHVEGTKLWIIGNKKS